MGESEGSVAIDHQLKVFETYQDGLMAPHVSGRPDNVSPISMPRASASAELMLAHSANRPAMAMPCSSSHARTLLAVAAPASAPSAFAKANLGRHFS